MPSGKQSERRVLLSGMFDMRNFGDLMFPLIAQQALAPHGIGIVPVSPSGAATGFGDAMASISLREMMAGATEADGVAIGGGYMIHTHKMHFLDEYAGGGLYDFAGPGLWLGATLAAARRDIPVAWNAPGVPHPFAGSQRALIDAALRAADYLSLRDRGSLELLEPPADAAPGIVPDPVAAIARLWPRGTLAAPFKALLARKGAGTDQGFFVLHFRNRSLAKLGIPAAAALVDGFAMALRLTPILIAVGQTHADDVLAREISQHLTTRHIVLDDPASLIEIAAAIAQSRLYIGASLHGYVTAAAYGVPGILVAQPSYRKFQGFLDHTGRSEDLVKDWPDAFASARTRTTTTPLPQAVLDALDRHWERMAQALADPAPKRAAREAFLRACEQDPRPAWVTGLLP
ncbi:MAG TPA: polysaccharide pyruvyl transferase family protein [Rhizomicrobium sp.]|nr:polysaccharide pyruvyl transferase family protein [Rhizomicrobium sp.]